MRTLVHEQMNFDPSVSKQVCHVLLDEIDRLKAVPKMPTGGWIIYFGRSIELIDRWLCPGCGGWICMCGGGQNNAVGGYTMEQSISGCGEVTVLSCPVPWEAGFAKMVSNT